MRRASTFRRFASLGLLLVLLLGAALFLRETGWLDPREGLFTAVDGDSLRKGSENFRLHAIDAPELRQTCMDAAGKSYACGRESLATLKRLVTGRDLTCRVVETDRYGRLVAVCKAGETDINREMVRLGWAIAYRKHGMDYVAAEEEAHAAARGLWQGTFDTPEAWRAANRPPHTSSLGGEDEGFEAD